LRLTAKPPQEGHLKWPAAKARLDEIRRRQADLEDERDRLESRLSSAAAYREQEPSLRALLERFGRRLQAPTPEERMPVVRSFVRRVTVAPDGGFTLDSYLPSPANSRRRGKGQYQYMTTAWTIPQALLRWAK
jgi:hypothetical protein